MSLYITLLQYKILGESLREYGAKGIKDCEIFNQRNGRCSSIYKNCCASCIGFGIRRIGKYECILDELRRVTSTNSSRWYPKAERPGWRADRQRKLRAQRISGGKYASK